MAILTGPPLATPVNSLDRSTTARATVGSLASSEVATYIYVGAGEAITTSGDPVSANAALSSVKRGDTDTGAFLGVAEAPFASGEYGYIVKRGLTSAVLASGVAAGGLVELSATVGQLKAITTSGTAVGVALEAAANSSDVKKSVYLF